METSAVQSQIKHKFQIYLVLHRKNGQRNLFCSIAFPKWRHFKIKCRPYSVVPLVFSWSHLKWTIINFILISYDWTWQKPCSKFSFCSLFFSSNCFFKSGWFCVYSRIDGTERGKSGIQKSRLDIAKREGIVHQGSENFPHLYVFDIFKKVLLGILVQQNLQIREGIVFKLTDHRRQHT